MKHWIWPLVAWVPFTAAQADPTLECSIGTRTQVETARCLETVEAVATAAMRLRLAAARSQAEELDAVTGRDVAVPALDSAQAAWGAYAAAQCDYAGALFGGGSGTGIEIRACRITLTRERTQALADGLR